MQADSTAAAATEQNTLAQAEQFAALMSGNSAIAYDQYNQELQTQTDAAARQYDLANALNAANEAAANAAASFDVAAAALGEMTLAGVAQVQIDALSRAMEAGTLPPEKFADAQNAILVQFGLLTPAEAVAQTQLEALTAAFVAGNITADQFAIRSQAVKYGLDAEAVAAEAAKVMLIDFAGENMASATAAAQLGGALGSLEGNLAGAGGAANAAASEVQDLSDKIVAIPDKTVTITVKTEGSIPTMGNQPGAAPVAFQHGGRFIVPGSGGGDRPYMLNLTPGELVTVTPKSQVNNFNLTVNSMQSAAGLQQDFAFMQAFAPR
jgi:hypothetical protein